jgi:inorganic phosphate transporter, PiT family
VLTLVVVVVVVALLFDYTNGFHDAANAIPTSVSTRALTPAVALALAAGFNLLGALLGQGVAQTIGSGVISPAAGHDGLVVVMAGLLGAIAWNLFTWALGLPSSSSHALIGGLAGAGVASSSTVHWSVLRDKVAVPMVLSPLVGFALAYLVMLALLWTFRRSAPGRVNRGFRHAQTLSACAMALGHGLQDAQKTMGVITLALVAGGYAAAGEIPLWVTLSAATAISLGTWSGGWRVMRTLGRKVIDLDPPHGFAAESVAASVLYTTAFAFQAPISTTHTITSAIMGVGATRRASAVRWGVAADIAVAWVLTIPMAAAVAAVLTLAARPLLG